MEAAAGPDESQRAVSVMELEGPSSPGIGLSRDSGGPGLLVPDASQGRGATALDALRVQRALGSRSPSLSGPMSLLIVPILPGRTDLGEPPPSET